MYSINCQDCNIGHTKRNIEIRLKEHLRNTRLYQIDESALAAHVWDKGHNIQNEIKLLKYITNPKDLTVWRKLFIKKNEYLMMNFDIPIVL